MTDFQKVIKYLANIFAVFLIIMIIGGILKVVAVFGFITNRESPVGENKSYSLSQSIENLDIEINAAKFDIKEGSSLSLESNLKNLTVNEKGENLIIKDTKKFLKTYNNAYITLYVPKNFDFSTVDISTGAGAFNVDKLSCDKLNLNLGAGSVRISSLLVSDKAKIEGGAGEIKIDSGEISNLDFDMGVGQITLTSKLSGRNELNFGVGEAKINLIGSASDYCIDFDKGIGEGKLMGEKMTDNEIYGSGETKIEIDGGVGSIDISFSN